MYPSYGYLSLAILPFIVNEISVPYIRFYGVLDTAGLLMQRLNSEL